MFKKEWLLCQYFSCTGELIIIAFSSLSFPFCSTEKDTTTTKIEKKNDFYIHHFGENRKKERKLCGLTKHTQVCKTSLQHKAALIETTD